MKKIIVNSLLILLFIMLVFCETKIFLYKRYEKSTNTVTAIIEDVNYSYNGDISKNIDFDRLSSINDDIRGWIKVNGTNIDYPFVQAKDNNYYLSHSFNKEVNNAGWIFLDYRNNLTSDYNTIIYGHAMLNKTMFGTLKNTLNKNWLYNKHNHIIEITTRENILYWQVFSVYHIKNTSDYLKTTFNDNKEYCDFLNMIINRSVYNFNNSVGVNDNILTLSTCYKNNHKLVLHAKLIDIKKD